MGDVGYISRNVTSLQADIPLALETYIEPGGESAAVVRELSLY